MWTRRRKPHAFFILVVATAIWSMSRLWWEPQDLPQLPSSHRYVHIITTPSPTQTEEEEEDNDRSDTLEKTELLSIYNPLVSVHDPTLSPAISTNTIHITHLFSSFHTKPNSDSWAEMELVRRSWRDAATRALQTRGIVVEFLDARLPEDGDATPSWARPANLTWRHKKAYDKGMMPTAGEPYLRAFELGHGQIVVATNADIGVFEDFYVRTWDWANTNYATIPAQLQAMEAAAKFLAKTWTWKGTLQNMDVTFHRRLLLEDAKIVFRNAGGLVQIWRRIARSRVCMLACKYILQNDKTRPISDLQPLIQAALRKWGNTTTTTTTNVEAHRDSISKSTILKYKIDLTLSDLTEDDLFTPLTTPELFAGTITRLDVPLDNVRVHDFLAKGEAGLKDFRKRALAKGLVHPGNDCFVITRHLIPWSLRHLGLVQGLRPFGAMITTSLVRATQFRRIAARRDTHPWTWHAGLGLWGRDAIPWKERAQSNPSFTIFLLANWDQTCDGCVRQAIVDAPPLCKQNAWTWRQPGFCSSSTFDFEVCVGSMHFACADYLHFDLRDILFYRTACQHALNDATNGDGNMPGKRQPSCGFCNFLLNKGEEEDTSIGFKCVDGQGGKTPYCELLGDACM